MGERGVCVGVEVGGGLRAKEQKKESSEGVSVTV